MDELEPDYEKRLEMARVSEKIIFSVDSQEKLEWYLRKVGNLEAEKARVKAQAASILKGLDSDLASLQEHFGPQVEAFVMQELASRGGKTKTLKTLQGNCAFRTVPSRLVISDEEAAMREAAEYCPEALVTKTSLDRAAFIAYAEKHASEDAEFVQGVEVVPERQSFSISFKSE